MPNLENLKKQAKQYLRWHQAGHYPVAEQIRAALPRFQSLDDAAVLATRFQLADAQELVARQRGFAGWQALITTTSQTAGANPMSNAPKTSHEPARLAGVEPQLYVSDISRACAFYTGMLGFTVAFTYGEPPFYAQVMRDSVKLNLRMVPEPVFASDVRKREELLSATILVATSAEMKALYLEFQAASVPFHQTLKIEPWGSRTFVVADPDENLLLFAGPGE